MTHPRRPWPPAGRTRSPSGRTRYSARCSPRSCSARSASAGGTVRDGFACAEGAFTMCSFWLVSAFVLIGELDRAIALCEKLRQRPGQNGSRPMNPSSRVCASAPAGTSTRAPY
jgi:hypothetical protein